MNAQAAPVAVITGGARRLGRHLSKVAAKRGYKVVVFYRSSVGDAQSLEEEISAEGCRARSLQLDIGDEAQVAAAFAAIGAAEGRVDLLVNNVGNYHPRPVTELDPAQWDETLRVNLSGAYYCCYHALKIMPDHGNIVNIGIAGLEGIRVDGNGADYFASKIGLLVLTRSMARGYAPRKIRVNMISPGQLENSIDLPGPREIGRCVPLDRAGTLTDISQAFEYLLDASYVTGVNIDVAGGYRL